MGQARDISMIQKVCSGTCTYLICTVSSILIPYIIANDRLINECDALVSNNGWHLISLSNIIPVTTSSVAVGFSTQVMNKWLLSAYHELPNWRDVDVCLAYIITGRILANCLGERSRNATDGARPSSCGQSYRIKPGYPHFEAFALSLSTLMPFMRATANDIPH